MTPRVADVVRRHLARPAGRAALLAVLALPPLAFSLATQAGAPDAVDYPHGKFRDDCALCHRAESWLPARPGRAFDHGKVSGFPLTGSHAAAGCRACHGSLDFTGTAGVQCASCHEDPHRGEFGTDCARCHGARTFIERSRMMRAHALTHFPLTGAHAGLDCETCHGMQPQGHLRFVGTPAECRSCHMPDYRATTQPPHQGAGFPLECESCHRPIAWRPARFDHQNTGFPLTGRHLRTPCQSCHGDGVYSGRSTLCVSCHQADYDGTNDPPHAASGFPTTCGSCHTTSSWDANFDHNATAFPLTGAHAGQPCSACHGDGVYQGKSTACVSCHQANYDATTNPSHAAAAFPLTCGSCHNTTSWDGATFDHDARNFPIYSGRHATLWSTCATCHTNPQSFAVFTCFSCHPHDDPVQTQSNHGGVSGYAYDSNACYSCHPRGTKP